MEFVPAPAVHRVLCADCGTPIVPNSANLCVACLRNTVDITEGIPKQGEYVVYLRNSTNLMLCRSIDILLPKLRTVPLSSNLLDDRPSRIARTSCDMPQETQGIEQGPTHGSPLYLDRTAFETSTRLPHHPKRSIDFDHLRANIRDRIPCTTRTMSGLHETCSEEHMEGVGAGPAEGSS